MRLHYLGELLGFVQEKTLTLLWGNWHLEKAREWVLLLRWVNGGSENLVLRKRNMLRDCIFLFGSLIHFELFFDKWLGSGLHLALVGLLLNWLFKVRDLLLFMHGELLVDELLLLVRVLSLLHELAWIV